MSQITVADENSQPSAMCGEGIVSGETKGVSTSLSTALSAGCVRRGSAQLPIFPAPECLAGVCRALGRAFGYLWFSSKIAYSGIDHLQHFGSMLRIHGSCSQLWALHTHFYSCMK